MLRNFKAFVVRVCDFEVEVVESINVEEEVESLDDGTSWLLVIIFCASVRKRERNGGSVRIRSRHLVVCLRKGGGC